MTGSGDLEPIGGDVEALLARLGMPAALDLATLADDWDEVAGEPFAGVSRPVGFADGDLVLEVDDGAAATLLRYRLGPLLDRLSEGFGEDAVRRVRIRVAKGKNAP